MEIIVGKQGQQPFDITDAEVSRHHLKITSLPNGRFQIEDNHSTNGTFVNGQRIIRKIVDGDTLIQLGGNYTFKVIDAIGPIIEAREKEAKEAAEFEERFYRLEQIYNNYSSSKVDIQKENAKKNYLRFVPMSLISMVGLVITLIPSLGPIRSIIGPIAIVAGLVLMAVAYKSQSDMPERMEHLNRQFQIDYVCPKCKKFLGYTPFEGIKNQGQCPYCKTKWVNK